MSPLRIKAIAKKEFIQVGRDPFSLLMAFLMPIMLLVIFGYAITLDVNRIKTVVYDQDKSTESRELIAQFRDSGYFEVEAYIEDHREIDRYMDFGKASAAIWVPRDFSKKLLARAPSPVQIVLDGSDSNTATIAQGYILAIADQYNRRFGGVRASPRVDARVRVWYNPELKSRNFIVPGLIAVIMSVIVALLTSLTIAREWERGTMEQLISTPVKVPELILGKLIPYFIIGLIDTLVAIAMSVFLFDVALRGSLALLIALSSVFLFGGLSLGILISITAKSQVLASQMAMIGTFLPAFLLSGFMFAISNMPDPLQVLTYVIPARYFVAILKAIFLKGSTLAVLGVEALLLVVYAVVIFAVANRKLVKRIM
ncbi:MAG: ABC transporter permease [Syntrophobacteraceae bacterium]